MEQARFRHEGVTDLHVCVLHYHTPVSTMPRVFPVKQQLLGTTLFIRIKTRKSEGVPSIKPLRGSLNHLALCTACKISMSGILESVVQFTLFLIVGCRPQLGVARHNKAAQVAPLALPQNSPNTWRVRQKGGCLAFLEGKNMPATSCLGMLEMGGR